MTSPITYPVDDKDLDDAALWAVIDSAAAASLSSSKSGKPLALKNTNHNNSPPLSSISKNPRNHHTPGNNFRSLIDGGNNSPPLILSSKNQRNHHTPGSNFRSLIDGEVLQEHWAQPRPQKMARSCVSELSETSPLAMVRHVQKLPTTPSYRSPDSRRFPVKECSPTASESSPIIYGQCDEKETMRHSLSGRFPSVSLFKEYQSAAMAILEKTDYTLISGRPFIKKTGWRKISCYFNISYEIKDKTIEFDENRNVQRSEFVVRAYMHGGRFSDGWGSCERREKKFLKPNNDIPSTAETRAKNKACQDLLGIGEYLPGASHAQ